MSDPTIAEISARLGRPLRVLHIGNIANNAYNNARIQRQYGIKADVICHDYYHVMATPEWEDGDLTTRPDPDLPNWWVTNLKGFCRPSWYVQGPLALCLDYLDAHRRGQTWRRWNAQLEIESAYVELLHQKAILSNRPWRDPRSFFARHAFLEPMADALLSDVPRWQKLRELLKGLAASILRLMVRVLHIIDRVPSRIAGLPGEFRAVVLWPLLAEAIAEPPRIAGASLVIGAYRAIRRMLGRPARDDAAIMHEAAAMAPVDARLGWSGALRRFGRILVARLGILPLLPLVPEARWLIHRIWPRQKMPTLAEREAFVEAFVAVHAPVGLGEAGRADLKKQLVRQAMLFGPVLAHYDIIQGYSTDGIIPLANGHKAFASYEHGTLRELPFEPTLSGILCYIAYTHSPAVFVTNTDVLPSVERLGLAPEKVHYLPHAFDDRKLMNWRDGHPELTAPAQEVVFFSPTRQHWKDSNRSLTKGNDIMLQALGRLWTEGRRFQLVMVEWGQDLVATKQLIRELAYEEAVRWVPPMGKQHLWRTYCTSHAVLDQFILPALGGVGFETLSLGCRLITKTDQPVLARFFGAAPPVLPAATVEDVTASMRAVLDDPDDSAGIGAAGRDWIDQYHSARCTVSIQAKAYRGLLESAMACPITGANPQ